MEFFLTSAGVPSAVAAKLSRDAAMLANAPTLRHDPFAVMGERSRGGRTPSEQAAGVPVPALVLAGGASPEWMVETGRRIAAALPRGRFRLLEGQGHVVPPEVLAPVVVDFLTEPASAPAR
ncbi:hypothetical protein SAMN05421810_101801 [Amycolatopsis arida]|uniref:Alpha/beta hydrolase family protein n=1 Tax=Amycolatopsis arida TaxID=587909 RepID=A0A1I5M6X6_9PSEU|nr:hypothetical protein CLV69_104433 [Amycolatopsis arida]SFP04771.1 hypothetical protein SAMN05421810_101801 [Amycolatopsis arida]